MVDDMSVFVAISEWLNSPILSDLVERICGFSGITSPADVDDLVQEVRIALWQKGLQNAVSMAWISRVASNKVIDLIRRRSRRRAMIAALRLDAKRKVRADPELACLLHASVSSFPAYLRRFYQLHYALALSERQIGKRLGILRGSVRALDRSCRKRLRNARKGQTPPADTA